MSRTEKVSDFMCGVDTSMRECSLITAPATTHLNKGITAIRVGYILVCSTYIFIVEVSPSK